MSKDKRKKGCPNTGCSMHIQEVKQSAENEYCPKCGTKLVFVCANSKCFSEITDGGIKHRLCQYCENEAQQKAAQRKDKAGKAAKAVAAPVVAVAMTAVQSFAAQGGIAMKGKAAKIGMEAAKKVFKI